MIIAIDGPSGAGKSSVAKAVARKLGFSCLDTGAMYRAITVQALQSNTDLSDAAALTVLAQAHTVSFGHEVGNPVPVQVCLDGNDVTAAIRTAEVDANVSKVSAVPGVRQALLEQQRAIGNAGNYVVEGRDIGTVVFPEAEVKVFLTASAEERARRRVAQNEQCGIGSNNYEEVLASIKQRDKLDSSRQSAPLRAAEGSVYIDSTNQPIDYIISAICSVAKESM